MKIFKALKRVAQKEIEKINIEEKHLKETRDQIMIALEQGRNASKGLENDDKQIKGLYWTGWKVNGVESSTMVQGQTVASVMFMGITKDKEHWRLFDYQEDITNPQLLAGEMQRIVVEIKGELVKLDEWYPVILQNHPHYKNYFEERIKR